MSDPVFALVWPRTLFFAEASRILRLGENSWLRNVVHNLLLEAYSDVDVAALFEEETTQQSFYEPGDVRATAPSPREWLQRLLGDDSRLQEYSRPAYWAHRKGVVRVEPAGPFGASAFALEFRDFVVMYSADGYFPNVAPVPCVDDEEWPSNHDIELVISEAVGFEVKWPISASAAAEIGEDHLFSLVEYFHDEAQRPRRKWDHDQNECGTHVDGFNRVAGGEVYRWKINRMLEKNEIPYRLGSTGVEAGRLIARFAAPLNELADRGGAGYDGTRNAEVGEAVSLFRARGSTTTQKRSALATLAGKLEEMRPRLKLELISKDESALFAIANSYTIRHRTLNQYDVDDPHFLEWIFWLFLATIQLMNSIPSDGQEGQR